MKIVFLLKRFSIDGGLQKVFSALQAELISNGHEVFVISVGQVDPGVTNEVMTLSKQGERGGLLSALRKAFRLRNLLIDLRPAVVMSGHEQANLLNMLVGRTGRFNHKIIVSRHVAFLTGEKSEGGVLRLIFAYFVYLFSSRVVVVSRGIFDELKALPALKSKTRVIYNPVVTKDFFNRRDGSVPWPTTRDHKIFVAAGRLVHQKGFDVLIEAFALAEKRLNSRLYILGAGPDLASLQALVDKLGLQSKVVFAGYIANPLPYYDMADVFVLSSRWEGFGLALAEALALGTKVVATDCPYGPSEILDGGRLGRIVPVDDHLALAMAMVDAAEDPAMIDEEEITDRFHVKESLRQYLEIFTD